MPQDELWKLEGPSDEEIQAAKAAMAKVPGTATSKEPLGAMAAGIHGLGCGLIHGLSWPRDENVIPSNVYITMEDQHF